MAAPVWVSAPLHPLRPARRLVRRIRNALSPGALILMYHRVAELSSDPHRLAVTPRHFAEHLAILRERAPVIRLEELVRRLQAGSRADRAIILTFDDGYADNLAHAKPLLERHEVPATVFVSTGYVGQSREFWWDELERLVLQPATLPRTLELRVRGETLRRDLGEGATLGRAQRRAYGGWHLGAASDPSPRHSLYRALYGLLHGLTIAEREAVLDGLRVWSGIGPAVRATHRVLTRAELRELGTGGLVEIGAHSVTHPALADLAAPRQRHEIQESRRFLEDTLGAPVRSIAYPHGSYSHTTDALVREAGFEAACTSRQGVVRRGADPFQLPRIQVRDGSGVALARTLAAWLS